MREALGESYHSVWAQEIAMAELGGRTAQQALDDGFTPKTVWLAVWRTLELPDSQR